jgi:hypothetical protein
MESATRLAESAAAVSACFWLLSPLHPTRETVASVTGKSIRANRILASRKGQ